MAGGRFLMDTEDRDGFPQDGEGPVREVQVSPPTHSDPQTDNTDLHVPERRSSHCRFWTSGPERCRLGAALLCRQSRMS